MITLKAVQEILGHRESTMTLPSTGSPQHKARKLSLDVGVNPDAPVVREIEQQFPLFIDCPHGPAAYVPGRPPDIRAPDRQGFELAGRCQGHGRMPWRSSRRSRPTFRPPSGAAGRPPRRSAQFAGAVTPAPPASRVRQRRPSHRPRPRHAADITGARLEEARDGRRHQAVPPTDRKLGGPRMQPHPTRLPTNSIAEPQLKVPRRCRR